MESSRTLNLYKFVDAGSISCGSSKEERAQLLTARLLGTDYDQLLLIPYNSGNRRTLVVINLTKGAGFWIDPLKNRIDPDVTEVVERSFNIMNKKKPNWRVVKCPKQSGVVECGYYVMRFMRDIIMSTSTSIIQIGSTYIVLRIRYFVTHFVTYFVIYFVTYFVIYFVTYFVIYFVTYFVTYFCVRATMENTVLEENTTAMFNINELSMCSMCSSVLLICVVDHEVLLKCVVDKKVLLKCVLDKKVLLTCVVYHEVLLKCVINHEVLLVMKCYSSVMLLKCVVDLEVSKYVLYVVDHEVLLKCVVDKIVLLKCVVHHEVLLKCVVDKKSVVDYEVLLKCVVDYEVLLKCVLPQSIGAMKPYLRQFIDV
ncbi:hypothetical protein IC582_008347 [Cucumis melo]